MFNWKIIKTLFVVYLNLSKFIAFMLFTIITNKCKFALKFEILFSLSYCLVYNLCYIHNYFVKKTFGVFCKGKDGINRMSDLKKKFY